MSPTSATHPQSPDKTDDETITIVVNTRRYPFPKNSDISFEEVVSLAYPIPPTGANAGFTVMYQRGQGNKDGTLVAGQSVKVKEGMIFDVTPTDLS